MEPVGFLSHIIRDVRGCVCCYLRETHSAAHGGVDGHAVTALVSLHVQRVVLQRAGQENISSHQEKQTAEKQHPHLHPAPVPNPKPAHSVLINAVENPSYNEGKKWKEKSSFHPNFALVRVPRLLFRLTLIPNVVVCLLSGSAGREGPPQINVTPGCTATRCPAPELLIRQSRKTSCIWFQVPSFM